MLEAIIYIATGWSLGAGFMWLHFHCNKLIRSREEWLAAKEKDEEL